MEIHFDIYSGIRERLFLLSVLDNPQDAVNWRYNPNSDVWRKDGLTGRKVRYEGTESLRILAEKGIDYKTAMEMIGYPEQ